MPRSIRARLTATFSICIAVLMIIAISGVILYFKHSAERNANSVMMSAAKSAALESTDMEEPYSPTALIDEEREDLRGSDLAISIIDRNGHFLAKSQDNAPAKSSREWRTVAVRIQNGDRIIIGMPWAKNRNALRYHAIALIWLGMFVIIVASIGAWVLVGRTLSPISDLARQAKASSADNLKVSLKLPSEDREIVELVETLNGLLHRITETTAAKGRFYSAASHELRTPLQALSGHLELALSRDRTKEEYKATAEEAYAQTRRLISLTRALLFLYQLDSSQPHPVEAVDLVDVCNRSLSHVKPIIEERRLKIDQNMPNELEIYAPLSHIEILVRNLIENAAKYTSEGGHISLNISKVVDSVSMEIANDCIVDSDWNPDEFFEPFSRPDFSRNVRTGGTGLGLAICKSIADTSGWEIKLIVEPASIRAVLKIQLTNAS